jgi:dTDP-4-amino-4,6-dideoxygalactose transaminase
VQHALTVVSRSHLPFARVLAASLAEHHDDVRLTTVVVDGAPAEDAFDVLTPSALGIGDRELHRRALAYDPLGLISSLRSHAIGHLLGAGARSVLLIDADMLVLAPLDDLWERAAADGVLLSPHATDPAPGVPGRWTEEIFLLNGTFNGGLLGVGATATPFLDWMSARTRRDCVLDFSRGLVHGQTWLNLVPALFPSGVIRDPTVNVSGHSLHGQDLGGTIEQPSLHGRAVRTFHFTPFGDVVAGAAGRRAGALASTPLLGSLWDAYLERLREAGWPAASGYEWDRLPSGEAVTPELRRRYREALIGAEAGGAPEPPDPFDLDDPAAFATWWDDVKAAEAAEADAGRIVFGRPWISESAIDEVANTLRSGWIGPGPVVARFERELERYLGIAPVRCVSSATAALYLILKGHDIGPGDEVLLPALTFVSCAQAIELTGATPVPVDSEPVTNLMSLELAETMITPRTRAIMLVHLGGRPADLTHAARLGDRHGLLVLEDAAHALGARWRDDPIGTHGNPTAFSFQATKNITSVEGGAIATPDQALAERLACAAANGIDRGSWARFSDGGRAGYASIAPGFKFEMTDVNASLGLHQLPNLDAWINLRARQSELYDASFEQTPLGTPAAPAPGTRHARHLYQVTVGPETPFDRDELARRLGVAGIGTGVHFPALAQHPYLRDRYGLREEDYPVAMRAAAELLSLPLGPALSPARLARVSEAVHAILGGA